MAHSKLYVRIMNSRQWVELRNRKIAANPLCERCQQEGIVRVSRCVHHLVPVESGRTEADCWELATRWSNLQALCFDCHAKAHAEEHSHSKEGHAARAKDRLKQWINKHTKQS